jgi:hypothetical protein
MGNARRHIDGHRGGDDMFLHLLTETYFDFRSEIADIVRISPEKTENLVESCLCGTSPPTLEIGALKPWDVIIQPVPNCSGVTVNDSV